MRRISVSYGFREARPDKPILLKGVLGDRKRTRCGEDACPPDLQRHDVPNIPGAAQHEVAVRKLNPHCFFVFELLLNLVIDLAPPHLPIRLNQAFRVFLDRVARLRDVLGELFVILHPATLPMLERMFEDVKQDAETDGEWGLKRRAEIGIAAARIAAREQEAIEN
jgi:hypothetical protein